MAEEGTRWRQDTGEPMVPRIARVRQRRREIPNTWTLELEQETGAAAFAPGQFNMLYMMGVGEIPISMSGDPARSALVHTIRAVGAVSEALAGLKRGATLGLRGPYGSAWPLDAAAGKDIVIMAGGIGLAPLRPLLYRLFARPKDYRRIVLLYGTRSPDDILYRRQLDRWREKTGARIEVTVDHAAGDWGGRVGVVTDLVKPGLFDPANAIAFICGPEVMMHFSVSSLMDLGLSPEAIHVSMERNMKCAIGYCGHCQFGPAFICKDGPVFRFDRISDIFRVREF
jgi:NAD(P)H-flavin reductase